jgi:hypothetical protein
MSNLINKAKAAMSSDKDKSDNSPDYIDNPQSSVSLPTYPLLDLVTDETECWPSQVKPHEQARPSRGF